MKKLNAVILAAGTGSRFVGATGELKKTGSPTSLKKPNQSNLNPYRFSDTQLGVFVIRFCFRDFDFKYYYYFFKPYFYCLNLRRKINDSIVFNIITLFTTFLII